MQGAGKEVLNVLRRRWLREGAAIVYGTRPFLSIREVPGKGFEIVRVTLLANRVSIIGAGDADKHFMKAAAKAHQYGQILSQDVQYHFFTSAERAGARFYAKDSKASKLGPVFSKEGKPSMQFVLNLESKWQDR